MNDHDLDNSLKSAAPPRRPDSYWNEFPARIAVRLHSQQVIPATSLSGASPRFRHFGALTLGFAAACIVLGLFVDWRHRHGDDGPPKQLAEARKCFQEIEALFPNQVRAIVFDRRGPQLLLAEKANVPNVPALYLTLCTKDNCESIVTFSGQEIPFNGQFCEVLADPEGHVMLVGDHSVWFGAGPSARVTITSQPLAPSASL